MKTNQIDWDTVILLGAIILAFLVVIFGYSCVFQETPEPLPTPTPTPVPTPSPIWTPKVTPIPVIPGPTADSFGVNNASGYQGIIVSVPVEINNVSRPINSITFSIAYNNTIINVTNVIKSDLTLDWGKPTFSNFAWGTRVQANYDGNSDHAIQDGTSGTLVVLEFEILGSAGMTTEMEVTSIQLSGMNYKIGTANDTLNGNITVLEPANISIPEAEVYRGETVTVPVMIGNVLDLDGIGTFQFELVYDFSVVEVLSVDNTSNFSVSVSNIDNLNGKTYIGCSYIGNPSSLTGNLRAVNISLKAVGTSGETSSLNLTDILLKDATPHQNDIAFVVSNGTFIILQPTTVSSNGGGGGGGDGGKPTPPPTITPPPSPIPEQGILVCDSDGSNCREATIELNINNIQPGESRTETKMIKSEVSGELFVQANTGDLEEISDFLYLEFVSEQQRTVGKVTDFLEIVQIGSIGANQNLLVDITVKLLESAGSDYQGEGSITFSREP